MKIAGLGMEPKIFQTIKEKLSLIPHAEDIRKAASEWEYGEKSKTFIQEALEVESLGSMPFSMYEAPPIIESAGEGAIIYDIDGKAYIDLMAGFSVNNLGYGRKEILDAIINQYKRVAQYSEMLTRERIILGKKLTSLTPGVFPKKVFYEVTGSGANEVAIKLSRIYTGRQYIITQYGDYHGRTIGTSAFTHSFSTWAQLYPIPPTDPCVIRIPFPYPYRCPCGREDNPEGCAEEHLHMVEYMLSSSYYGLRDPMRKYCNVAAFLIEPFQSAAGYIIPPDNWVPGLYRIAREYDILFIVDEIQTGLGRTGKLWAVDHYQGVEPDMMIIGKAISGGLPFSVVVGRREIMDSWGPGAHSSTFAGYMLGVSAALATLNIFEREKPELESAKKGEYFLRGLIDLANKHPIIGDVQGKGLYIGIEFVKDRKSKQPAAIETKWMTMRLVQLGILVKRAGHYGNRFALSPPFTITYEQIDRAIELFDRVFGEAEKKFNIEKSS